MRWPQGGVFGSEAPGAGAPRRLSAGLGQRRCGRCAVARAKNGAARRLGGWNPGGAFGKSRGKQEEPLPAMGLKGESRGKPTNPFCVPENGRGSLELPQTKS